MMLMLVHDTLTAAGHILTDTPAIIPDPAPKAPQGLAGPVNDWLGYLKWACGIAALVGVLAAAVMMGVGIRGRSDAAKWALSHLPWALGAAVLSGSAAELVRQFTGS